MALNSRHTILAATAALGLSAPATTAEETQKEITSIIKNNGASQSVLVVPASECGDGGGTTYTSD